MLFCWLGMGPLATAGWTDGRSRRIPDACVFLLASCGVLRVILGGWPVCEALSGLLLLGGGFLICGVLEPSAVGGGDIKLCAALGVLLGPVVGVLVLLLTMLFMVGYGLIRRKKALPLAAFILPAYIIILIGVELLV